MTAAQRIADIRPIVELVASTEGVPPALLLGVIWVESRAWPAVTSKAGAIGLMQLLPSTLDAMAKDLGLEAYAETPYVPELNIRCGTRFLRRLLEKYGGREDLALAAYYLGPRNVTDAVPANARGYVDAVQAARDMFAAGQVPTNGDERRGNASVPTVAPDLVAGGFALLLVGIGLVGLLFGTDRRRRP